MCHVLPKFFTIKYFLVKLRTEYLRLIVTTDRNLKEKINFLNSGHSNAEVKNLYKLKDKVEEIDKYRKQLKRDKIGQQYFQDYDYRVFDTRKIFYYPPLITRDRFKVMKHILKKNLVLASTRLLSSQYYSHCFVADKIADIGLLSARTSESTYFFPLYIYNENEKEINQQEGDYSAWGDILYPELPWSAHKGSRHG